MILIVFFVIAFSIALGTALNCLSTLVLTSLTPNSHATFSTDEWADLGAMTSGLLTLLAAISRPESTASKLDSVPPEVVVPYWFFR